MLTRAQNSEIPNPHTSKIAYLLPVYGFRKTRHEIHNISDPHAKFGEIRDALGTQSFHNALIETKSGISTSVNPISISGFIHH